MTPWTQTVSGFAIDLLAPDLSRVDIDEIAWGLSRIPRFNGQTRGEIPYSVAQHSVHVARLIEYLGLPREAQFAALMHDAHEAFIGDIPTPVKIAIGGALKPLDERLERAVRARFGLASEFKLAIKAADIWALVLEREMFMAFGEREWGIEKDIDTRFDFSAGPVPDEPQMPAQSYRVFRDLAAKLSPGQAGDLV